MELSRREQLLRGAHVASLERTSKANHGAASGDDFDCDFAFEWLELIKRSSGERCRFDSAPGVRVTTAGFSVRDAEGLADALADALQSVPASTYSG
jgi:hypothetical protein